MLRADGFMLTCAILFLLSIVLMTGFSTSTPRYIDANGNSVVHIHKYSAPQDGVETADSR